MNSAPPLPTDHLILAIPNFNGAKYLARTLESLAANGSAVRWWLQDNCSTDDSLRIAKSYARPCDTICQANDSGQADALNRVFEKMGGAVIGFINSDDCLCPNAADQVLGFFNEHPEIDLVYGEVEWIDENDQVIGTHAGRIDSLAEMLDVFHVWWRKRQWVQPEVFFRRSLWEKAGPFDCRYDLAFDYDFWVRCFRAGARVARLPVKLAQFRHHSGQKSMRSEEAAAEIRMILKRTLEEPLPISKYRQWALWKHLEYDLYRIGKENDSFPAKLLSHPEWLMVSDVRDRILFNLRERLRRFQREDSGG